jgi:dTDP-glucose 4,6-dehydratase
VEKPTSIFFPPSASSGSAVNGGSADSSVSISAAEKLAGASCLVTGGAGFIGSHLTRLLVAAQASVTVLVSDPSRIFPMRIADLRGKVAIEAANLADAIATASVIERVRPDFVFHLAAFTHVGASFERASECVETNVTGTFNLLEALRRHPPRRFIYIGSSEIYGDVEVPFTEDGPVNPVSPYAVSKYAAERLVRIYGEAHGISHVCLRPFNAYGPGQSPDRIIPETITKALRGRAVEITGGIQTREFNYVEDLAEAFVKAATAPPQVEGQVINVGCGEEISMKEIAAKVLELMGNPVELRVGSLPYRPKEIWRMYCDNSKARALLEWEPKTPLEEGLKKTIEWYTAELANPDSPYFL